MVFTVSASSPMSLVCSPLLRLFFLGCFAATFSRNRNSLHAFMNMPLAASLRDMPSTNLPMDLSFPTRGV